jgi:hypothetical protein
MAFETRPHAMHNHDVWRAFREDLESHSEVGVDLVSLLTTVTGQLTGILSELGFEVALLRGVPTDNGFNVEASCGPRSIVIVFLSDLSTEPGHVVGFRRSDGAERTHPVLSRFGLGEEVLWMAQTATLAAAPSREGLRQFFGSLVGEDPRLN